MKRGDVVYANLDPTLGSETQKTRPVLIVVMGVVVMLIVLAVLLPIIQLNTWVK